MEIFETLWVNSKSSVPLSHQLKVQITYLIANGSLKPGDRMPPLHEMADRLSINLHTVRQTYLKLVADGMVEMVRGRGTYVLEVDPWRIHQAAEVGRTYMVGVILPSIQPFYESFLQGVYAIADENQTMVIICMTKDDPGKSLRHFAQLASKQVDGVIVVSHDIFSLFPKWQEQRSHSEKSLPLVTVDWPQCKGICVLVDLENAGYQATHHLLEHGQERVGLITFAGEVGNVVPVNRGYQRALQEYQIPLDNSLISYVSSFGIESGAEAAHQLLSLPEPPTSIFAISDTLALGAMLAIKQAGLRIPQDVALTSFNDTPMAKLVDPPLTTVNSPTEDLGREAMKTLQLLITGKQPRQKRLTLPTSLVVRQSCGCT